MSRVTVEHPSKTVTMRRSRLADFRSPTDQVQRETLQSAIQAAYWDRTLAAPGDNVSLRVYLHFVGYESEIKIEVRDSKGTNHLKHEGETRGNQYTLRLRVPEGAQEALFANVSLPKHGLKSQSDDLRLVPAAKITNVKWDRETVRREEEVGLSADIANVQEGADAKVEIFEHDQDGAHDPVATILTRVKDRRIDLKWLFEYLEDTDDIPTKEEAERGYFHPEYFFRVTVAGAQADSALLQFKDWIEVELKDADGEPVQNAKYRMVLPSGEIKLGSLDGSGRTKLENLPPGKCQIEFEGS
jgi:hypothetical protein